MREVKKILQHTNRVLEDINEQKKHLGFDQEILDKVKNYLISNNENHNEFQKNVRQYLLEFRSDAEEAVKAEKRRLRKPLLNDPLKKNKHSQNNKKKMIRTKKI